MCAGRLLRPCDCDVLNAGRADLEASLAELDEQIVTMLQARDNMGSDIPAP